MVGPVRMVLVSAWRTGHVDDGRALTNAWETGYINNTAYSANIGLARNTETFVVAGA